MFSKKSRLILEQMGVDPESYSISLSNKGTEFLEVIDQLLHNFGECRKDDLTCNSFNSFMNGQEIKDNEFLCNHTYDIYNYLRLFRNGGRFSLFKFRQAEWDGPNVLIDRYDVPQTSDLKCLSEGANIYRGMSLGEFKSNKFGQSWTTDISVAKKFAFVTYKGKPQGVVAATLLEKKHAIYFSQNDAESEVIMDNNSIKSATLIES